MPNSGIEPKFAIYKIAVLTVVLIRLGGGNRHYKGNSTLSIFPHERYLGKRT